MSLSKRNFNIDVISDLETRRVVQKILEDGQDRQLAKLVSDPTGKDIDERELKTFEDGDNKRIQTKMSGDIVSVLGAIADTSSQGDVFTMKDISDGSLKYVYVNAGVLTISGVKP